MKLFSINLGDVICGLAIIYLTAEGLPLPAIAIISLMCLIELARIRRALESIVADSGEKSSAPKGAGT